MVKSRVPKVPRLWRLSKCNWIMALQQTWPKRIRSQTDLVKVIACTPLLHGFYCDVVFLSGGRGTFRLSRKSPLIEGFVYRVRVQTPTSVELVDDPPDTDFLILSANKVGPLTSLHPLTLEMSPSHDLLATFYRDGRDTDDPI